MFPPESENQRFLTTEGTEHTETGKRKKSKQSQSTNSNFKDVNREPGLDFPCCIFSVCSVPSVVKFLDWTGNAIAPLVPRPVEPRFSLGSGPLLTSFSSV